MHGWHVEEDKKDILILGKSLFDIHRYKVVLKEGKKFREALVKK